VVPTPPPNPENLGFLEHENYLKLVRGLPSHYLCPSKLLFLPLQPKEDNSSSIPNKI